MLRRAPPSDGSRPLLRRLTAAGLCWTLFGAAQLAAADQPARPLPKPLATVKLTEPDTLAVRGPAPVACDDAGAIYVVDRAGFRVMTIDPAGRRGRDLSYPERGPDGQKNLASAACASGGNLYLSAPDTQRVCKVPLAGEAASWLGVAAGGIPFLQVPTRLAPSRGGLDVWDPALKMVITMSPQGGIVAAEKRVGLTPWPHAGGGHLYVTENPEGSWRLKSTRGGYDGLLPSRAGGRRTLSCELVGPAPAGGWVAHHYLGEPGGRPAGACLRWLDEQGRVRSEAVFELGEGQDLPPPPGSTVGAGGRVCFLSCAGLEASVMVAGP